MELFRRKMEIFRLDVHVFFVRFFRGGAGNLIVL
jgi:hypothetical protein